MEAPQTRKDFAAIVTSTKSYYLKGGRPAEIIDVCRSIVAQLVKEPCLESNKVKETYMMECVATIGLLLFRN